jgi:hypothetical protein
MDAAFLHEEVVSVGEETHAGNDDGSKVVQLRLGSIQTLQNTGVRHFDV